MKRKEQLIIGSVLAFLLLVGSLLAMALAESSQTRDHTEKSCPHQEVKQVPGSQIVFQEDAFDFGQIPTARKVTHIFRFQNVGTTPLLLAQHVESKPIEGC